MLVDDGTAWKSASCVENLVAAKLFALGDDAKPFDILHYVDHPVMTTGQLVGSICRLLGRHPPRFWIPLRLASSIGRDADLVADSSGINFPITAARIEGFSTSPNGEAQEIRNRYSRQPVGTEEAFRTTVRWHLRGSA